MTLAREGPKHAESRLKVLGWFVMVLVGCSRRWTCSHKAPPLSLNREHYVREHYVEASRLAQVRKS
jgi:hypothetical protein